ncbi:hypothetical protein ABFT38_002496 [Salmonella enterica]|nr:hypothetical protein [Salmonella enterica]EHJ9402015.1 hypothetical protein [Salmonella enterica]
MKSVIGALSGLISYTESKKMTMAKIKCHVSNIAFMNMQNESFAYAMQLAEDADKCRSFAAMGNAIQKIITEIERVIDAAHAEALEFNAEVDEVRSGEQWDEWANQHDSRKTEAQKIESDHAEALEINEAVEIAGRVIQAMKGADIDCIMTGVRGGMYRSGLNDINALAVMALCIEINRAHREACEINVQIDSVLMDLAVTIARLPEGADCGRHCINSLEFINKSYGVDIHPRMLADLVDRAAK